MKNMRFKVGDRVRIKSLDWYNENKTIHGDIWFDNSVFVGGQSLYCGCELTIRLVTNDSYYVIENDYYWTDEMIEGLVEEMPLDKAGQITDFEYDGLAYTLPDGYQFKDENGNVINATKIVLEKKKKEYPKTYEECCEALEYIPHTDDIIGYKWDILQSLQKLLICRDAYWKIAGEEMGLGKPWEPDFRGVTTSYVITVESGKFLKSWTTKKQVILTFPTEEMRDAFYEAFKKEIEICKELL